MCACMRGGGGNSFRSDMCWELVLGAESERYPARNVGVARTNREKLECHTKWKLMTSRTFVYKGG